MRIRHIPYANDELCASPLFVRLPIECKNNWRERFSDGSLPLVLELGCGKGDFAVGYTLTHPDRNLLAIDIKSEMLLFTKRKLEAQNISNALLTSADIERIDMILGERDEVEAIYINFCNPWPKPKQHKKRLTHTKQLLKYRDFLVDGGVIELKTDDEELFCDTLQYLAESGFSVVRSSCDIYADGLCETLIQTEHERMFRGLLLPIYYVKAKKDCL